MPRDEHHRVAVIGAGPAGLAAAHALTTAGLSCDLFDDNSSGGGQYFRQLPPETVSAATDPVPRDGRARSYLAVLSHPLVRHHPRTTVWALPEPLTLAYVGPQGGGRVSASAIVIATGAQDRPCPFPGWTLPGVVSAGGCLNLLKGQGMLPGRRIAVVGNGPLVLVAAYSLIKAGAEVRVVAEAAPLSGRVLKVLPLLLRAPGLLAEGINYRAVIAASGATYHERFVAVEAYGSNRVEAIGIAPVSPDGRPIRCKARRVEVDAVVSGYGLMPSTEFTRMIGCGHRYDRARGGWIVERSREFETNVGGIFVVGDAAGIGGAEIALAEGSAVGGIIARRLSSSVVNGTSRHRLERLEKFRSGIEELYSLPEDLKLATPDTILCRCEDVTLAAVASAAKHHDGALPGIKAETRATMGRCQGRNCLPLLAQCAAEATGRDAAEIAWPRMRPPARPIPVAALLNEALGPVRSPDMVEIPK